MSTPYPIRSLSTAHFIHEFQVVFLLPLVLCLLISFKANNLFSVISKPPLGDDVESLLLVGFITLQQA